MAQLWPNCDAIGSNPIGVQGAEYWQGVLNLA